MPVSREPVNVITGTSGWRTSASPASSPKPWTICTTPSGMPASCSRSTNRCASSGVSSAGLRTTVLPQTSAGQSFHGGDRDREVPRRDRADDADRHPDAHHELVAELRRRRLADAGAGPRRPCSSSCRSLPGCRRRPRPSPSPSRGSSGRRARPCRARAAPRSGRGCCRARAPGTSRQSSQAARAVATARSTSAAVERGKVSISSPVDGFRDSKVAVAMRRS